MRVNLLIFKWVFIIYIIYVIYILWLVYPLFSLRYPVNIFILVNNNLLVVKYPTVFSTIYSNNIFLDIKAVSSQAIIKQCRSEHSCMYLHVRALF